MDSRTANLIKYGAFAIVIVAAQQGFDYATRFANSEEVVGGLVKQKLNGSSRPKRAGSSIAYLTVGSAGDASGKEGDSGQHPVDNLYFGKGEDDKNAAQDRLNRIKALLTPGSGQPGGPISMAIGGQGGGLSQGGRPGAAAGAFGAALSRASGGGAGTIPNQAGVGAADQGPQTAPITDSVLITALSDSGAWLNGQFVDIGGGRTIRTQDPQNAFVDVKLVSVDPSNVSVMVDGKAYQLHR